MVGSVTLSDGRRFGYDEVGAPAGDPVLFVPGSGASSLNRPPAQEAARRGLRMVCVDKPGYGESTAKPGYSLKDLTDDITGLVDTLGWDRFAVLGFSIGGWQALALARQLPGRVTRVVTAACPAPTIADRRLLAAYHPQSVLWGLLRVLPPAQRAVVGRWVATHDVASLTTPSRSNPYSSGPDQQLLRTPEWRLVLEEDAPRVFGNGPDALLDDLNSAFRQPRLDPADVPQRVTVVHGAHDQVARPVVVEVLTELLPDATCHVIDDGGHWIHMTHAPLLLDAITGQEPGASE